MRLVLAAATQNSIPPSGYGGTELVIWNWRNVLVKMGHEVHIVNEPKNPMRSELARRLRVVHRINAYAPDLVHLNDSMDFKLRPFIRCRHVLLTDHAPEVSSATYRYHYRALRGRGARRAHIICLSERIRQNYLRKGADADRLHVIQHGVNISEYRYSERPKFSDRSIYLAVVNKRKRQHLFSGIPGLFFAGPIENQKATPPPENYLGEWSRQQVRKNLANYANLVLLSKFESQGIVSMEAMAAGLGVVISETASVNMDPELPFIDVIPEDRIRDRAFVARTILENREKSIPLRTKIRAYASENFSIEAIVQNLYIPLMESIAANS